MARIFISHSSANNAEALALRDWLVVRGWDDLFLDIDPHRGLVSGQRWLDRLEESAQRCKAVLFVLSRAWLASRYCTAEFWEARKQDRPLFAVVIDDTAVAEVPAEMRGVWQLAFLTRGSRFETFSVLPPPDYLPTPVRFSQEGLEALRLGLVQAELSDTERFPWPTRGFEHEADGTTPRRPYRGLEPVDAPDAGVFFGRDSDLERAGAQLTDLRDRGGRCLFIVLGASGSGKSSFLRAGLLPRLARDDRRFLPLPALRPRGAALWGNEGLLAALEMAHQQAGLSVSRAELRKDLKTGGTGFLRRLADLRSAAARDLPEDAKPPTLIVPVDQAEELFTTVRGDRPGEAGAVEAHLFLTLLAEALRHGPEVLALVTIRSDAYELLQTTESLASVPQVLFSLRPLAEAGYRSVIEGPARRVSKVGRPLTLEPELTEALLADAQGAGTLPLLGFILERLYVEHGGASVLTLADYDALGGVQGSIEAAVAQAFADPDAAPRIPSAAAEREALLKRVFVPYLMGLNEANGEPVRHTARLADLPAEALGLIDRLIDRRLLVVDRRVTNSGAEETVIEVAHEALLRRWWILGRWLDEERTAIETQQEITRASTAWNRNARKADWLIHHGARLTEAEAVARREDFAAALTDVSRTYLDACRQAEDAAREAEAWRLAQVRQNAGSKLLGLFSSFTRRVGSTPQAETQRSDSLPAESTRQPHPPTGRRLPRRRSSSPSESSFPTFPRSPKVFLSYSHDSQEHMDRVLALCDRLRADGVDAWLDQYEIAPPEGWPHWCARRVTDADFVLVVCTETYERRFSGAEVPGEGLGVRWEGYVAFQELYDTGTLNAKYIPVLWSPAGREQIPLVLRGVARYDLNDDAAYWGLYRHLTGRPKTPAPPLGERVPMPPEERRTEQFFAAPEPSYEDDHTRRLGEELAAAQRRLKAYSIAGQNVDKLGKEILDLRRALRDGERLLPGNWLGKDRFQLLEVIGHGGFGTVWKAWDEEKMALVAVKILHGLYADDRTRRERFFRGARKMADLHHPGIVRVIEPGLKESGKYFFVMEYVKDGDLRQAILAGKLPQERVLPVILAVGEALAFAHERGIIHRDVKPANILLDRDLPKLTDFDLVRAVDTTGGTRTQGSLGTAWYSAPEIIRDAKNAGVTADVFSLAMTTVFAFHGSASPESASSTTGEDLLVEIWRRPEAGLKKLPCIPKLRAALRRGLSWEPEKRYSSVAELCKSLQLAAAAPAADEKRKRKTPSGSRKRAPGDKP